MPAEPDSFLRQFDEARREVAQMRRMFPESVRMATLAYPKLTKEEPMPKLTPWFDWPVKPVREGWYDVRLLITDGTPHYGRLRREYWNGRAFERAGLWPWHGDQWRGLAEKP